MNLPDGYNLLQLTRIDSTNEEAKRLINSGAACHGMVIVAEEQMAGHGRYGRVWESPQGNLYTSIILKLDSDLQKNVQLSFVAALAAGGVIAEILPENCHIQYKWPNDVLVNGAKIAGILLESLQNGWFIVGIGINVESSPAGIKKPVTSLKQLDCGLSAAQVLPKLILFFDKMLNLWKNTGFSSIRTLWLEAAWKLNEEIAVNLSNEKLSGIFKGISSDGALELLVGEKVRLVSSGEVFF